MTFFPDPIHPAEGKKEEEIRVSPIEATKQGKEKAPSPENEKSIFYGGLLLFIQKVFSVFSGKKENADESFYEELTTHLKELKELFEKLKAKDLSQNIQFCETLSRLWHAIKKELDLVKKAKSSTLIDLKKLDALLKEIGLYPAGTEHSLGYYLTQYTGEKWLPLPFMEILASLHTQFVEKKEGNELGSWTFQLGSLLDKITEGRNGEENSL